MPKPSPRVVEALRHLPSREGDVMQLMYRGLTEKQIAASPGVTRGTVFNARRRAVARVMRMVGMGVEDA